MSIMTNARTQVCFYLDFYTGSTQGKLLIGSSIIVLERSKGATPAHPPLSSSPIAVFGRGGPPLFYPGRSRPCKPRSVSLWDSQRQQMYFLADLRHRCAVFSVA